MRGSVTFVCGPPGSGKSTYCRNRATGRDLIWDLDVIAGCLNEHYRQNRNRSFEMNEMIGSWRDSLIAAIREVRVTNNAWIIISDREQAFSAANKIPGASVVVLTLLLKNLQKPAKDLCSKNTV